MKKIYHLISGFLAGRNLHLIKSLPLLQRKRLIKLDRLDYVRLSSLELAAHEINLKQVKGNVAELGVYKGDFAKDINSVFPDRSLYLFDTFEGFDKKDIAAEVKQGFSDGKQDFSDTSAEYVLSRMPHKEKVVVRKGFFPETAIGIEDTFVFVSLDTDLYEPIYAGLQYFYPRLASGGYIFVHDFNNDEYKGASQAVRKFCTETKISYTPIADIGGSVIITKG